jgi:DNA-directed RNA polymerase specialized sigma24 family protein
MTSNFIIMGSLAEDPVVFRARFWRFYRLQYFIACRVLGGPERADDAIDNCWLRASRNPPRFKYEGAFRSWLIRVLIDEAVAIRDHDEETNPATLFSEHATSSPRDLGKLEGTFAGGTQ